MLKKKQSAILTFLATLFILPTVAYSDDWIQPGEENITIRAGAFLPWYGTDARVDSSDGSTGTGLNLEDDLGFDGNQVTFYGDVCWRFFSRNRVTASFFQMNRNGTVTAKKDIEVGNETFPAGATLSSEMDFTIIPFQYSFSFLKDEKYEMAASIGLHWYDMKFKVDGSATVGGTGGAATVDADAKAPLPLIGLRFDYYFTPKWTACVHAEVFKLNTSNDTFQFSGSLFNVSINTDYWFYNHFGVGAAFNYFALNVDVDSDDWKGSADYRYWGPQVYLMVRF